MLSWTQSWPHAGLAPEAFFEIFRTFEMNISKVFDFFRNVHFENSKKFENFRNVHFENSKNFEKQLAPELAPYWPGPMLGWPLAELAPCWVGPGAGPRAGLPHAGLAWPCAGPCAGWPLRWPQSWPQS